MLTYSNIQIFQQIKDTLRTEYFVYSLGSDIRWLKSLHSGVRSKYISISSRPVWSTRSSSRRAMIVTQRKPISKKKKKEGVKDPPIPGLYLDASGINGGAWTQTRSRLNINHHHICVLWSVWMPLTEGTLESYHTIALPLPEGTLRPLHDSLSDSFVISALGRLR